METLHSLEQLPGAELVLPGLIDAEAGRLTIPACLIWIAMPRLAQAGLISPIHLTAIAEPERTLYRLLQNEGGNAYGRYNSLLRRLVSFQHGLNRLRPDSAIPAHCRDTSPP